jgi:glucose-1-phosphatase
VTTTRVVMFDLGGVLVEMRGGERMRSLLSSGGIDDVWQHWRDSLAVHDHETGRCNSDQFADRIIAELNLTVARNEFLDAFLSWPGALFPGVEGLIASLGEVQLACLSNTSHFHWHHQEAMAPLHKMFPLHYLSFEIGIMKPQPEIYAHVQADLGCPPEEILFFDDLKANVDAALDAGWQAYRVAGIEPVRQVLAKLNLIGKP